MLKASIPARFNIPFANASASGFTRPIPQASQIGITNGAASLTDGFPPLNFQPVASGGIPPFGEDFNGILNQISAWSQWFEAGGPINWDATFAAGASGGYPQGAIVQSNITPGNFWLSTQDNNTNNPDALSPTGWVPLPGMISSGTPVPSFSSTVPTGFVAANAQTIGNAASNATGRANADTQLLYRQVWLNFSNTACPLLNSAGAAIARGANPDADFAANNQLTLPDARGRGVVGVDTMGGATTARLAGVPVTLGGATTPGSIFGENLHTLTLTETPTGITVGGSTSGTLSVGGTASGTLSASVSSTVGDIAQGSNAIINQSGTGSPANFPEVAFGAVSSTGSASGSLGVSGSASGTLGVAATSNNTGGGAHNTVSQSLGIFWNLKL
jgi:hypothetical protein